MRAQRSLMLVLAVMLAFSSGAWARGSGIELGAFGTYLDTDDLGDGYGAGAKLELQAVDWMSVDARASYINFSNPEVDLYPLEIAALLNIPLANEQIVPYAGIGAGYYIFDASGFEMDDEVGFFPLIGMEFGAWNLSFMLEARWLFLESDLDKAVDQFGDASEADLDGLGINFGLLFRF
ncbi:MAG: outer membrane beta-barrel protein [Planctomycetota bacterium]